MWTLSNNKIPVNLEIIPFKEKRFSIIIWFHIPNVNLDSKQSILFHGPKLWNNLTTDVRAKKSTLSVKTSSSKSD